MNIEQEIFKKSIVDFNKLTKFGFYKQNDLYIYTKNIMNNTFRIEIKIDLKGTAKGKIIDLSFGDEYTNFRIEESTGSFVGAVREEFVNTLKEIKEKCYISKYFSFEQSNRITSLIKEKYNNEPEFEWEKFPDYATFRNENSKKWYAIIMNIDKNKLDSKCSGKVEIINVKLEPDEILNLLNKKGFYKAYHMNKKSWVTIILDDTLSDKEIINLIDKSYSYTVKGKNNNNEWIIPANPKYFDIEKALKENKTILWKQSTDIKANDIIYLYVASPYSSIMYKFKVLEPNIEYEYKDKNLKMKKVMKMSLIEKYKKGKYSFNKLKEYGINAVRGPRYMPLDLSKYINDKM